MQLLVAETEQATPNQWQGPLAVEGRELWVGAIARRILGDKSWTLFFSSLSFTRQATVFGRYVQDVCCGSVKQSGTGVAACIRPGSLGFNKEAHASLKLPTFG